MQTDGARTRELTDEDIRKQLAFTALMNNLAPEMVNFIEQGREGVVYLLALKMTEKNGAPNGCCIASARMREADLQLSPPNEATLEGFRALHEHMKEAEFVHDEQTMPQRGQA